MKMAVRGALALVAVSFFAHSAFAQQQKPAAEERPTRSQVEEDIEKYWGKRRKVTVIQKRKFPKTGRFEISAHFGVVANDPFLTYLPVGVRGTYHFKEWLGAELGFMYMPSFESNLKINIESVGSGRNALTVQVLEQQKMLFHLSAVFSLLYGKVALMQTGLSHFDVFLTAGPSFHIVSPPKDSSGRELDVSGFRVGGQVGVGMKFFINDFFGIRLDVRQYLFPKSAEAGGGLHKPTEISLGATFFAG